MPPVLFFVAFLSCSQALSMDYVKKGITTAKKTFHDWQREKLHKAFFAAAKDRDLRKLQGLIENPVINVNAKDTEGNTALHMVAWGQQEYIAADCVELLTHHKAHVNTQNNMGNSPLHIAACRASAGCITKLVEKEACLTTVNNERETALHLAIINGNDSAVNQLLALKADPNQRSGNQDMPPLCIAVAQQNATARYSFLFDDYLAIGSLLKAGARINICGIDSSHPKILSTVYGPMVAAIQANNSSEVKRYLDQGVCKCLDFEKLQDVVNIRKDLHFAKYLLNVATNCEKPHAEMVCFLMDAGCLGGVGYDILRNAFMYGNPETARLLISHIPRYQIRRSWNHVALPLLLCLRHIPQQLPMDVRILLCLYCVRSACIAEQIENCHTFFRTKVRIRTEEPYFTVYSDQIIPFKGLNSYAVRNADYLDAYTHILDNVPTWQKQIDQAIINRPNPKKNETLS